MAESAQVVPLVRGAGSKAVAGDSRDVPLSDELVAGLVVLYALDLPDRFHVLTPRIIEQIGTTPDMIRSLAVPTLAARARDKLRVETHSGCEMVFLGGGLEASTLLLQEWWNNRVHTEGEELVVAVPTRDVVIFCPRSRLRASSIERARDAVLERADSAPVLGGLLLRRVDEWVPFRS